MRVGIQPGWITVCFPLCEFPVCCATVSVVVSRCGLAFLPPFSAAHMADLAPLLAGLFLWPAVVSAATINQRSGWALGWWACCVLEGPERALYGKTQRRTHQAPLPLCGGAFVWAPGRNARPRPSEDRRHARLDICRAGSSAELAKLLHHDPAALDFVQAKPDRCGRLSQCLPFQFNHLMPGIGAGWHLINAKSFA